MDTEQMNQSFNDMQQDAGQTGGQQSYNNQYQQGYSNQYQQGYNNQYQQGYNGQYQQGYNNQYQQGYNGQYQQGYNNQYQQGYNNQYQQGYNNQYQQGYNGQYQQYGPYDYRQGGGPFNVATGTMDAPSGGILALSLFFPLVGLILYLVWKDEKPLKAKSAGKGALIGVGIWFILVVIYLLLFGVFLGHTMSYFRY